MCKSRDKLKDLVIQEQLLNTLPEDVHIFVKERKLKKSDEARKLADDYIVARKENAPDAKKNEGQKVLDR